MYENINKNNYTPMMRQYLEIKENYPDTLVFFRLGDFYEMFFNDAIVASRELEIVLTSRDAGTNNDRVPMCGVPFHAVSGYIERLSERGYKVAIVEQLEEPSAKKIVKRDIVKIVTPGTNVDEEFLDEKNNSYLGCLEKYNDYFILSYIELSTGETKITTFKNIDSLIKATKEELLSVEDVGERIADSLLNYFSDQDNLDLIARLKDLGLQFEIKQSQKTSEKLSGLAFVVSGTFTNFSREELKKIIEENSGKVLSGVSSKTDYLICGENTGPQKKKQAEKLGVKMIEEQDFIEKLNIGDF